MARIPLITDREGLVPEARAAFDRIVESRGELLRPFQVLLHVPAAAARVAELGHALRFGSGLEDRDRELVTLATGRARGCAYVWDSHVEAGIEAGVRPEAIAALEGEEGGLDEREEALVAFVDELCRTGAVTDRTFAAVHDLLGTSGTVELAVVVGYYTMLGLAMSACEAC